MSRIEKYLKKERDKLLSERERYTKILEASTKGSIVYKTIRNKKYPYLTLRENGKAISRYIKEEDLDRLKEEIRQRRKAQKELKRIAEELYNIYHGIKEDDIQ